MKRAQALIIQGNKALFGSGIVKGEMQHFFIGGGIEEGETSEEAVLRELMEEANVSGKIIFEVVPDTFLVDIGGQTPVVGFDPEEEERNLPENLRTLQKLIFVPLDNKDYFTPIDIKYLRFLKDECIKREYFPKWYNKLIELVG